MEEALGNYIKNYNLNDPDINYKYHHSYRVMKNAVFLAEVLNLSKEDKKLAQVIGLYHDIGRFEQDKLYNSFNDNKNFDHAEYGVKVLFEQNLIKQIPIEEKYYHIIEKAIKNHNKFQIEEGLNEQELLHSKIIRDADKIDIVYAASEKIFSAKVLSYEDENVVIRDEIKEEFYSNKTIKTSSKKGQKTNSEKVLSYLALIFDLNFKESAQYILDNKIIENFYNSLKNKEKYQEYFSYAIKYLKEMTKC